MKSLFATLSCLSLLAGPVFAQDRPTAPTVFILNDGSAPNYNYDRDAFLNAAKQADNEIAAVVAGNDPAFRQKAKAAADDAGANIVYLSVTNLQAKNSKQLKPDFEALSAQISAKPKDLGWQEVVLAPTCRLYTAAPSGPDQISISMLAMMDDPYAKVTCFRMTMAYFAGVPNENGERVTPIYLDGPATAMQAMLPAIEVSEAYLGLKAERDEKGRYKRRESNIYAPKEEIFLRAYLDHVGRKLAGTMDGSYQIDLSVEISTPDGTVLKKGDLYSYKNPSTLFYPIDKTYFWNDITAGIALEDPGDYVVKFIFKDGSRPEMPPAEAAFPVTITAN